MGPQESKFSLPVITIKELFTYILQTANRIGMTTSHVDVYFKTQ